MALSAVPFALQNGSHPAALFRQAVSSLVFSQVGGLGQFGDLSVGQTGTASMNVVVGIGRAWVPGTNVTNPTGFTYNSQGLYFAFNDANVTLSINAADPTNPRIDIVCLTVNDSFYSGSTNNAVLQVITGVPASSPSAPTTPANSLVLAQVNVAANATSITTANITNVAIPGNIRHAEYSNGGGWSVTGGQAWDIGPLSITAPSYNNSFSNTNGVLSGQINITETGVYSVFVRISNLSGDPGQSNVKLVGNGSSVWAEAVNQGGSTPNTWEWEVQRPNLFLTAGQTVRGTMRTTNTITCTTRLSITKVQG